MKRTKNLDFEINLLPVISILAVCLSFLLLTSVWVRFGTFNLSQAVGTDAPLSEKSLPSLWIHFENDGTVQISVKDTNVDKNLQFVVIQGRNARPNIGAVERFAKKIKKSIPQLTVALLMPAAQSSYEDMIAVMDSLKKQEISDLGIAPL